MSRSQSSLTLNPGEVTSLLSLFPKGLVAIDLETTGLSPLVDKIIEIAAIKIAPNGEISTFHTLINPLIDIPEGTIQFHGLTNNDLVNAPTIRKPIKEFWAFLERYEIIAHNSAFDLGWLIKASHDYQVEFPPLNIYDSCRWARAAWKQTDTTPINYKLSTLSEFCGFPLAHHIAMEDTLACLKIMAKVGELPANQTTCREKSFVFRLSQFDRNDCFNFSTRLSGLPQLVQSKDLLSIEYRGTTIKHQMRPVRPIGLMPLPKGPVLFGECLLTGMNKSFLLKKIKSFTKLEACYWSPQK
jgi:DNA polymerase III subunit epsilon